MNKTAHYQEYLQILHEELLPAMGCTEPIAIALAAAKARKVLGAPPERVELEVSGNIIKNVKSVTVPNTGGLKGMEAAVAAGIVAGRGALELEVRADNARAIALYQRLGFVRTGDLPRFFRIDGACVDAVRMQLDL